MSLWKRILVTLPLLVPVALLTGCSSGVKPVPVGVIPEQGPVPAADEQYGQQVVAELANKYQISSNDQEFERVQRVVDRLTKAANANKSPWNVYVFDEPKIKNAGATRGNFVFVWSGMLDEVHNDAELSTIIAHEIAHVLAGHTADNPEEEVGRMIAGISGMVVGEVVSGTRVAPLADLAEFLVRSTIEAIAVNPASQRKEFEADQIGIFMMADAGYEPEAALDFWDRARNNPDLAGSDISFLSTHPSSSDRFERLRELLPDAQERYRQSLPPPRSSVPAKTDRRKRGKRR